MKSILALIILFFMPIIALSQVHIGNGADDNLQCVVFEPRFDYGSQPQNSNVLGCYYYSDLKSRSYELPAGLYSEILRQFEQTPSISRLCVACLID